jgi:hypothetical protein
MTDGSRMPLMPCCWPDEVLVAHLAQPSLFPETDSLLRQGSEIFTIRDLDKGIEPTLGYRIQKTIYDSRGSLARLLCHRSCGVS